MPNDRIYYVDGFKVYQNTEPFYCEATGDIEQDRHEICDHVGISPKDEEQIKEFCAKHNKEFPDEQPYYYEQTTVMD